MNEEIKSPIVEEYAEFAKIIKHVFMDAMSNSIWGCDGNEVQELAEAYIMGNKLLWPGFGMSRYLICIVHSTVPTK